MCGAFVKCNQRSQNSSGNKRIIMLSPSPGCRAISVGARVLNCITDPAEHEDAGTTITTASSPSLLFCESLMMRTSRQRSPSSPSEHLSAAWCRTEIDKKNLQWPVLSKASLVPSWYPPTPPTLPAAFRHIAHRHSCQVASRLKG